MDEFMDKLLKIQSDYFRRRQFLFILDLISVFSIFYAIFIIFSVDFFLGHSSSLSFIPSSIIEITPPVLAFIIAVIGAFLLHRNDHKINVNLLIEKKYPELNEKLRTAYDNRNETNVIVEALKSLVLSGLTVVSSSRLIATSIVVTRIGIVIIFVSTAAVIPFCQDCRFSPETLTNTYTNISKTITGSTGGVNETITAVGPIQNIQNIGTQGSGDIIGKPKIASLQGKNIDLSLISGISTGFVPSAASQQQNQFIRSGTYPVDVLGSNVSDGGYGILMQKTEAEKKLIQDYAVERSKI
ncbi:MAG: hypothetical protein ABOK23_10960 [Candidatus Methanoperedens sp.]|nr:hypothetical protein [Candidatus Methanoperedens sp.]MCZ7395064.1 hypothetical protein [Candidatus Methanoperedens sp.]